MMVLVRLTVRWISFHEIARHAWYTIKI